MKVGSSTLYRLYPSKRAIAKNGRGDTMRLSLVDRTTDACRELARELGANASAFGWDLSKPEDLPAQVEALVLPGPVRSGLEAHARSSFPESAITRWVPTGEPEPLAARIVRACEEKLPRVVYPRFYDAANRLPALTTRATELFSPHPKS